MHTAHSCGAVAGCNVCHLYHAVVGILGLLICHFCFPSLIDFLSLSYLGLLGWLLLGDFCHVGLCVG